ncbi:putative mboat family protein [Botrytis fragariae]|uniref:Putative mboat family protein n=1 Tax=Botrytis fragariae TaxID=1964551 RepID=A0A8H6EER6_9HELO|nr:putative mboat family protein [Botrytis fragariae]KAF5869448.1 putative mboat family protein [Botrytis fragariae]
MVRMASTTAPPPMTMPSLSDPAHPTQNPLDKHSRENGVGNSKTIQTPKSPSRPEYSQSLKTALETVDRNRRESSEVSESDSLEDYDTLKPDPTSIITRGKSGILDTDIDMPEIPQTVYAELKVQSQKSWQGTRRRKSIPVTLNKLQKNGQGIYTFEADDNELRDLLKGTVAHYAQDIASGGSKKRTKFSDLVFTKKFTAFDRHNNIVADSPFHGFFTLGWLAFVVFVLQLAFANWRVHGNILGTNEIMEMMFHRDVIVLGLSDGVMCFSTGFGLVLQKLIHRGYIDWNREGWIIQSAWEILYLSIVISWTLFREWPWTHTVFFVLHGIVMLMKQHSYAFYNGHLSEQYKTHSKLQRKLKQLDDISPIQTPSATTPAASSLSTSYLDARPTSDDVYQRVSDRRRSIVDSATDQVAAAIDSGEPLDVDQVQTFARILKWEIDFLGKELEGKCTTTKNQYPNNLSLVNHYEYIVLPTLVYELEYPRSDDVDWYNVAEKSIATAGLLIVMNLISQTYIYPIVVKTIKMKESNLTSLERLRHFPGIVSDLAFPFLAEYILTWYVIWECILNLLAELTCYADRGFYEAWWNSVSWDQFARDWNRPVHNFLLRHVYHSSISSLRVDKKTATLITFFLSACVHELVMWCIFKKLRGYLLVLQMCQIPLTIMSQTKWMKGKKTLGNVLFWIGIFTGPSLLCSLYLVI